MVLSESVPVWIATGLILVSGWGYEQFSSHTAEASTKFSSGTARISVLESQESRDISDLSEIRLQLDRIEAKLP